MLDQLPLELIQLIVHLALPSHYTPLTYRDRQDTLLALCSTSRVLLKLAQPSLFEVVELGTRRTLDNFLKAVKQKKLRRAVKALRLFSYQNSVTERNLLELEPDDLAVLFKRCRHLETLYVHNHGLDYAALEPLKKLRVLDIRWDDVDFSRPVVLPTLQHLSLEQLSPSGNVTTFALNKEGMPALESLTLTDTFLDEEVVPLLSGLLTHVTSLVINGRLLDYVGDVLPSLPRVLTYTTVSGLTSSSNFAKVASLRVLPYSDMMEGPQQTSRRDKNALNALNRLRVQLKAGTLPLLRYLYLPEEYLDFSAPSQAPCSQALKDLREISRERGVQIAYEPRWGSAFDGLVAPEFLRRCRVLKEGQSKKEKRKEGGGVGKE